MRFHEEVTEYLRRRVDHVYAVGDRAVVVTGSLRPLGRDDVDWTEPADFARDEIAIDSVLRAWTVRTVAEVTADHVVLDNGVKYESNASLTPHWRSGRACTRGWGLTRILPVDAAYVALVERAKARKVDLAEERERYATARDVADRVRDRLASPGSGPLLSAVRALLEGATP